MPIKYTRNSPAKLAASRRAKLGPALFLRDQACDKRAQSKAYYITKTGLKHISYASALRKNGQAASPKAIYMPTAARPHLLPSISPESIVKRYCRVKGTTGTGIFIKAPTAIRAANKAHRIIFLRVETFKFLSPSVQSDADFARG